MRKMLQNEMLTVTDAGDLGRKLLAQTMAPLYNGKASAWLCRAAKHGAYKVRQVKCGEQLVGVYWGYYSRPSETFVVNACGSLVKFDVCSEIFYAIEAEARLSGAKAVQFQTARRGLVEKANDHGYVAEAVVMTKLL